MILTMECMDQPIRIVLIAVLLGVLLIEFDDKAMGLDQSPLGSGSSRSSRVGKNRRPDSAENLKDGFIVVEPQNQFIASTRGEGAVLRPYLERRRDWGKTFSLSYSQFTPIYYEPNFYSENFDTIYSSDDLPLIEMTFSWKRNFHFGSLGVELGLGAYQNESDVEELPSTLKIYPIRLGGVFAIDGLSSEPYLVPYLSGGLYTIHYSESVASSSFNGFTQTAFYAGIGVLFQLNWCDPHTALDFYLESGVENTFLFLEGRKFLSSSATKDPDFETDFFPTAGIRAEY